MKQIDSKTDPYPLNPKSERQTVCNEKIANDVLIVIISLNFLMTRSKKRYRIFCSIVVKAILICSEVFMQRYNYDHNSIVT